MGGAAADLIPAAGLRVWKSGLGRGAEGLEAGAQLSAGSRSGSSPVSGLVVRRRASLLSTQKATATKATQANMKVATKFSPMSEPKGAAMAIAARPAKICHPLKFRTD